MKITRYPSTDWHKWFVWWPTKLHFPTYYSWVFLTNIWRRWVPEQFGWEYALTKEATFEVQKTEKPRRKRTYRKRK